MDVRLPNGKIIKGVPEGTTKDEIMQKAISSGIAVESDFIVEETAEETKEVTSEPEKRSFASPRAKRASQLQQQEQSRRESFLSGLPPEQRAILEDISGPEAFLIGMGRGFTNVGRGVGLMDDATESEQQAYKNLKELNTLAAEGGELIGESAPFVPLAVGASTIPVKSALGRAGITGLLGGTESGIISKGEGASGLETATASGVGALLAGGLELAIPVIGRIGGKIVRKVTGKAPKGNLIDDAGLPTPEFQKVLDDAGLTYSDVLEESGIPAGSLNPEQLARQSFLRREGIEPTKAQVTREAADFQAQQEAAKTSGRVRSLLEEQESILSSRFDNVVKGSGGDISTDTNPVVDALTSKATKLDSAISDLYKKAREVAPNEKNVRFSGLASKLRELAPANRRTGGNISAIVGDLQAKGILDKDMKLQGRIDVDTAEDVRKLMNELYDPQNEYGNSVLRELKSALDDDVFKSSGDDIFKQARKAKRDFEQELSRAKISKFDSRKQNLVRDVLENKIDPDQLTDKVVFGKTWRSDDLQQLKDYISTDEAGQQAFNDLRADVLQRIKDQSFIGPEDADGLRALSRDKLERSINKIGDKKLKVLFNDEERAFLKNMLKVAKLREPVRGTQQGLGPSAQAVKTLTDEVRSNPLLRTLFDTITLDANNRAVIKASPKIKEITPLTPARTAIAGSAAAASQAQAEEK